MYSLVFWNELLLWKTQGEKEKKKHFTSNESFFFSKSKIECQRIHFIRMLELWRWSQTITRAGNKVLSSWELVFVVPWMLLYWAVIFAIFETSFAIELKCITGTNEYWLIVMQMTVKKTLSNFRRTHHDNWQEHKQQFTDDQLLVLTDLLVSPCYYA